MIALVFGEGRTNCGIPRSKNCAPPVAPESAVASQVLLDAAEFGEFLVDPLDGWSSAGGYRLR